MKLFCNGFNIFRQLNVNTPIVKEFIQLFHFEVIKQVHINQSYTVLETDTEYLIFHEEGVCNLKSLINKDIKLLASNDDCIVFLDVRSNLLKAGINNFGKPLNEDVEGLDLNKLVKISTGTKLIVAYLSDGSIYKIPHKLQFNCKDIVDVQCGKEHCLLLDKQGNVYSFGGGSRGQLGHGKLEEEPEPQLVEALAGIKIRRIAAGGWHSCAISKDGDLYVWGWNSNGQLALGKEENDEDFFAIMAWPLLVELNEDVNVVFVACGSRHMIAYLDNNELHGCGWNKYHQLTNTSQENYFRLTHLHDFKDQEVVDVHCGPWNSAVRCK